MNSQFFTQEGANTPSTCFQKLCQVMLDGSSKNLTKKKLEDFRVILHMLMRECSRANIETGKIWIFEHCNAPIHAGVLMEYMLALSQSRSNQEDRIHIIYLLNDILFHAARKQLAWMRDAMLPLLVPLLRLAYDIAESSEYKAKVIKVITFWGDQHVFDPNIISNIKRDVTGQSEQDSHNRFSSQHIPNQPAVPYHQPMVFKQQQQQQQQAQYHAAPLPLTNQFQNMQHHGPPSSAKYQQNIPQPGPPIPQRPYHELPAGLMLLSKNTNYKPIDPAMIKVPFPRPVPSKELIEAVDDFYNGLSFNDSDDIVFDENKAASSHVDAQGWEKGYLDRYMEAAIQRQHEPPSPPKQVIHQPKEEYSYRSPSRDHSRGRSRDRSYSRSYSRSPSYHRRHRTSYSKSRSRSRTRGRRNSPPRGKSPMRRGRSPPKQKERSPPRRDRRRYSRSRSRSPPSSFSRTTNSKPFYEANNRFNTNNSSVDIDPPVVNKYMGLGNRAADEFDSFRKSKMQAYKKREPYQPFVCYKCNQSGHLARECNSL